MAEYALIDGIECVLEEVVEHAVSGERICIFATTTGSRRYVTHDEWIEASARFESHAQQWGIVTSQSPPAQKIALFRSLFRGRTDVFARGYLGKDGNIRYGPVCAHGRTSQCPRWTRARRGLKCSDCPNRDYVPLSDHDLKRHFTGADPEYRDVVGLYVLDADCCTHVLVADFDKDGWQQETVRYCASCAKHGLMPAVERSRSGNGAHAWLFFAEPVSAKLARDLGSAMISEAMADGPGMTFDSYDRLFPTQSTLRDDGLGNLIALPFQSIPMRSGNSVFVDIGDGFKPYADQWRFLSTVQKVTKAQAEQIVAKCVPTPMGELVHADNGKAKRADSSLHAIGASLSRQDFPGVVHVTYASMLYVHKDGISSRGLNHIRRLAAFANPEFYRAQAMHQSVYNKPRIRWCGEENDECVLLPRGCKQRLLSQLGELGVVCQIADTRNNGDPLRAEFMGTLRPRQQEAADAMLAHECGVLSAPTGFGKTVIGAYMIASLGIRALVVVPKAVLVNQWVERLDTFLQITDDRPPLLTKSGKPSKRHRPLIGQIGGGKNKPSGLVDVATFQSLTGIDDLGAPCAKPIVQGYDLVICDECHHGAAPQLELVMKSVCARRVYGLSATPKRSDGLQSVIFMQCGPIRHIVDEKEQMAEQDFDRFLEPRFTRIRLSEEKQGQTFNELVDKLCVHAARNRLIVADTVSAVEEGRTPLVVSRRVEHVSELAQRIEGSGIRVFVLTGKGTAKERRKRLAEVRDARGGA